MVNMASFLASAAMGQLGGVRRNGLARSYARGCQGGVTADPGRGRDRFCPGLSGGLPTALMHCNSRQNLPLFKQRVATAP